LLLLDFDSGEVVQIAGRAALNWDANAQRYSVAVDVTAVRHWSKVL
jgi:hypothetical protein